jgi:hypothetical protein
MRCEAAVQGTAAVQGSTCGAGCSRQTSCKAVCDQPRPPWTSNFSPDCLAALSWLGSAVMLVDDFIVHYMQQCVLCIGTTASSLNMQQAYTGMQVVVEDGHYLRNKHLPCIMHCVVLGCILCRGGVGVLYTLPLPEVALATVWQAGRFAQTRLCNSTL